VRAIGFNRFDSRHEAGVNVVQNNPALVASVRMKRALWSQSRVEKPEYRKHPESSSREA